MMHEVLDYSLLGNTLLNYLVAAGLCLGGVVAVLLFKKYALSRLKKWAAATETSLDDLLVNIVEKSLVPAMYLGALYVAALSLHLAPSITHAIKIVAAVLTTFWAGRAVISAVQAVFESYVRGSPEAGEKPMQIAGIRGLLSITIWGLALVILLDNLGVRVTGILAGLGIGGIAVALASQVLLRDLFSYFVIFFDKPFELGDFIIVGDEMGTVEYTGIKTTRIRALNGELIVLSNAELTSSRIHNYKKMERRRVLFKLGVTYQTRAEQLRAIPKMVQQIIEAQADTAFDRGHFAEYGDFSLNFEFVYYVISPDYNKYMDIQQAINLGIFEAFAHEKIEFAYPSQTLYLVKP